MESASQAGQTLERFLNVNIVCLKPIIFLLLFDELKEVKYIIFTELHFLSFYGNPSFAKEVYVVLFILMKKPYGLSNDPVFRSSHRSSAVTAM